MSGIYFAPQFPVNELALLVVMVMSALVSTAVLIESRKMRQALIAAWLIALVFTVKTFAADLFVECDWATLESQYGYAGAWLMWIMGGC